MPQFVRVEVWRQMLSPCCGQQWALVCRWSHRARSLVVIGISRLRRDPKSPFEGSVQRCPQLSPVVVHRPDVGLQEIPPVRKSLGTRPHQFSQTAANTVAFHRRTDPFRGRKRHTNGPGGRVSDQAQRQRRFANDAAGSKRGETDASWDAADHADKRARPLSRRDFKTARPPLVFIRLRNPCFFARRRLLGWNVRFTPLS